MSTTDAANIAMVYFLVMAPLLYLVVQGALTLAEMIMAPCPYDSPVPDFRLRKTGLGWAYIIQSSDHVTYVTLDSK